MSEPAAPQTVFVAFGSNRGDRTDLCRRAVTLLGLLPGAHLTGVSSLYETEPVRDARTDPGPDRFLNGAVRLQTDLPPRRLLEVCQEVERALGRHHDDRGARTMDLDLLFYGTHILREADLSVPHPRLHLRPFVLVPLVELQPDWHHPEFGLTVRELLDRLPPGTAISRIGPLELERSAPSPLCQTSHRQA